MNTEANSAILFESVGRIAKITINRPEAMNAVNAQVSFGLKAALDRFAADDGLWVAVITGQGDKAFCAGADLKERAAGAPSTFSVPGSGGIGDLLREICDKPVIAAVNGYAFGGGMELALWCDLIVAAESAQFALPEVRRGLIAAGGGLLQLPRQIPLKTALYHVMTGEPLTAAKAQEWGLVSQVVPSGQALSAAMQLAEKICANAPLAVRESKKLVYQSLDVDLYGAKGGWPLSDAAAARIRESSDSAEGPRAFAEKRAPQWQGK